jgi:deazaflavin-dependent oxidoreductase (nitroreductase family)
MWYNTLIAWLLRSPLHGILSKGIMLITVTGRKSGRKYTTPVNYVREGEKLWVTSYRQRTWWRNLIGGAPVSVLLAGRESKGRGEALTDEMAVRENLRTYLHKHPQYARYYGVKFDPAGQPDPDDLTRAAQERLMIRIDLGRKVNSYKDSSTQNDHQKLSTTAEPDLSR